MCPVSTPPFVRNGQGLLPDGSDAAPSLSFLNDKDSGLRLIFGNSPSIIQGGSEVARFNSGQITLPSSSVDAGIVFYDIMIQREASGILSFKRGVNPITERIYRTYTDASNYERLALQSVAGIIKIDAETLGSGVDDIDLQLTPSGIGKVRFGTYAADALGIVTGYITIKDEAGNIRKLMIQV